MGDGTATRESISGEKDPLGAAKDEWELRLQRALRTFWQDQRERVQQRLEKKIPASRKAIELPDSFWDAEERELLAVLMPLLQEAASLGVNGHAGIIESMGVGVDWTMSHTDAANWARKYGGKLVRDVTRTTRDRVGVSTANWIETPGSTMRDLWQTFQKDHAFSESRARLIAITETTAAFARGELAAARQVEKEGLFTYDKIWYTTRDDSVCPICEGLNDKRVHGTRTSFAEFGLDRQSPPAHPGCRCWVAMDPVVDGIEEGIQESALEYQPGTSQVEKARNIARADIEKWARARGESPEAIIRAIEERLAGDLNNPLAVRRGDRGALALLEEGRFRTQFETGTSGGMFDPEFRARAERLGLGVPSDIAAKDRPVYGYVSSDPAAASYYGRFEFQLKDDVKRRTTITLGDSLLRMEEERLAGTSWLNPSMEGWGKAGIKYHDMGVSGVGYIEAQIQGGVTVGDVASLVIHDVEPAVGMFNPYAAHVAAAQQRGIEVIFAGW